MATAKRAGADEGDFSGFGEGAVEFFSELEANNTRQWWHANKDRHASLIGEPLTRLGASLEPSFGPVKVFRPYRDVRFSADKRPIKEQAALAAGDDGGPVLYMQLSADGLMLAGGYYQPARPQLDAFRSLLDQPRTAAGIRRRIDTLAAKGYTLHGDVLKTAPRGWSRGHPQIELLRHTNLAVSRSVPPAAWLATPEARDRVVEGWRAMAGWNQWLHDHLPAAPRPEPGPRGTLSR